jgi:hypothetical protein
MEKRKSVPLITIGTLALVGMFGSGCISHSFLYKFDLAGNCDFTYTARGDSADIFSPPGSYPTEPFFQVKTRKEVDSTGTETFILEAHRVLPGDSLPETMGLRSAPGAEVFLEHPAKLKRTSLFFAVVFKFDGIFKGRNRTEIEGAKWDFIPEECRVLENDEDSLGLSEADRIVLKEKYAEGLLKWNKERYKRRIREILKRAQQQHPDIKVPDEWLNTALAETDSLIERHTSVLNFDELNLSDLEWWDDLAPEVNLILSENLNIIGDSTLKAEIIHIGELLEMRHQVTEDLMDESFEVRVDLPGRVLKSDAKAMDTGVLIWKFKGEDLADEDISLPAFSLYLFADRIVGILVLAVALFIAIRLRRASPESKEESESPVSPDHDSIPPVGHG